MSIGFIALKSMNNPLDLRYMWLPRNED